MLPAEIVKAQQLASLDETITFFYYEDLGDVAFFYEDLLQLTKTMDQGWVIIYRISPTSSVGLVQQDHGFHSVSADKPVMLSMVTDDVDAWYEHLAGSGVVFRSELAKPGSEPEPDQAPVRGFVVENPGGYTVEFF